MRSSDGRPTRLMRLCGLALAIVACIVLLGAAPPAPGAVSIGSLVDAPTQGDGSGGLLGSGLGLILIVALAAVAVVALTVAAVVLFRTRGAKAMPASEDWWTCSNCGAGNMDGAPRCRACATWRTTSPRPTPST